jgi:endonuclease YncB( thermonuclease family)
MLLLLLACFSSGLDDTAADTGPGVDPITLVDPSALPAGDAPCREPELVRLEWVVDGDTIHIESTRGDEDIRFIGIDTAEVDHDGGSGECGSREATDLVEAMLVGGKVWLTFDAECKDDYDRTLAFLHVDAGEQGFLQRRLLRSGWATTFTVQPNDSLAGTFSTDEEAARQAGSGGWDQCGW